MNHLTDLGSEPTEYGLFSVLARTNLRSFPAILPSAYVHGANVHNDREVRDAILMLVSACKDYQLRDMSQRSLLPKLRLLPPEKRATLTDEDVRHDVMKAYSDAEPIVALQAAELEAALSGSGPYLDLLIRFANRHYLDHERPPVPE